MGVPSRDDFERPDTRWLKRGGRTKADLKIVDLGQGPLVVKDFRHKPAWVRLIGRLQIARECRAYRWIGPQPGLPRFVGRVDAHALVVELVPGERLAVVPEGRRDGAATHARLREIVERVHRAGLFHLDLRGRDNVLFGPDGQVYVVDLASAFCFRPDGWPGRMVSRWFEMADRAALLKWKIVLDAGPLTERERAFLRRYRYWRALWLFNRKRPPRA
jgi:hypothetical protein